MKNKANQTKKLSTLIVSPLIIKVLPSILIPKKILMRRRKS